MDKLGDNYTVDVYWLKGCDELVKIEKSAEDFGLFFNKECYIIDAKSSSFRYMICWQGPHMDVELDRKCNKLMD
jgi:hypothetical protein